MEQRKLIKALEGGSLSAEDQKQLAYVIKAVMVAESVSEAKEKWLSSVVRYMDENMVE